jgi:hypothetical protein
MGVILDLDLVVDFLEWDLKEVQVVYDTYVLFVTTNTKVELVHDVAPKCKEQIFD